MKIAVPVAGELLCPPFGHCDKFALVDVDTGARTILKREDVIPPPHQPGVLPGWLQGHVAVAGTFVQMPMWNPSGAMGGGPSSAIQPTYEPHQWMSVMGRLSRHGQSSAAIGPKW